MPFAAQPLHHREDSGARETPRSAKLVRGLADGHLAPICNVTEQRQFLFANGRSGHVGAP
jgi:hypothetical protein